MFLLQGRGLAVLAALLFAAVFALFGDRIGRPAARDRAVTTAAAVATAGPEVAAVAPGG